MHRRETSVTENDMGLSIPIRQTTQYGLCILHVYTYIYIYVVLYKYKYLLCKNIDRTVGFLRPLVRAESRAEVVVGPQSGRANGKGRAFINI